MRCSDVNRTLASTKITYFREIEHFLLVSHVCIVGASEQLPKAHNGICSNTVRKVKDIKSQSIDLGCFSTLSS